VQRAVFHLVGLPGTTGHHEDVRPRHVGQRGRGGQGQDASVVGDGARLLGDEDHVRAGQPAEHLVGTDRVQRGEPLKEQDGDLHVSPW